MKTWKWFGAGFLGAVALVVTGCGGSGDSSGGASGSGAGSSGSGGASTPATAPAETKTSATTNPADRLVGTWLGVAYLEEEKVQAKLASLTDETARMSLTAQAETFQTMVVGADFSAAGEFTIEAELTPVGGQATRDASSGTWQVKTASGDVLVVVSQEAKADGTTEASEKQYTFVDDSHFVWIPAVSQDLRDCDAMIVFEKQVPSTGEGAEVAEAPAGTEVR